jgi:homoserine O-acetyltransferase
MDTHNIARNKSEQVENELKKIHQRTLVIGISSDILCPLIEQQFLAKNIPNSNLIVIDSSYGHDGFMVESALIAQHLSEWLGNDYSLGYGASI